VCVGDWIGGIISMLFSVVLFLALLFFIVKIEIGRRSDLLSIILFIFFLQIILPGIALPLLIFMGGEDLYLGNVFLDRIYHGSNGLAVVLTSLLASMFVFSLYVGYFVLSTRRVKWVEKTGRALIIVRWRLFGVLALGVVSMLYLFLSMPGASVGDKYFNLVLFRSQHESFFDDTRNFVTSNLFSLTQTFAISATFLFFYLKGNQGRISKIWLAVFVVLMIFMATFAVSRRIIMIQLLVIYFALVLKTGKWYFRRVVWVAPLALLWLGFGKDLIWQLPQYLSGARSEVNLEMFFDDPPIRFGLDHIISVARRLPLGVFGVDEDQLYGPRIVRISTETFVDGYALDIPPGLMGQMWLDFRILGPIVWGLVFGVLLRYVQVIFSRFDRTWTSCGIFAVVAFVIALPINSGSFDFSFSVDIIFLMLFMWFVVRVKNTDQFVKNR
jgi:hypothetical protein